MVAILDFKSKQFMIFFYLQVGPIFPTSFGSVDLSVQGTKGKIDFQDGCHGGHLGFPIKTILAFVLSISCPDISYQVSSQLAFQFRR